MDYRKLVALLEAILIMPNRWLETETMNREEFEKLAEENARLRGELSAATTDVTGLTQIAEIYEAENARLREAR